MYSPLCLRFYGRRDDHARTLVGSIATTLAELTIVGNLLPVHPNDASGSNSGEIVVQSCKILPCDSTEDEAIPCAVQIRPRALKLNMTSQAIKVGFSPCPFFRIIVDPLYVHYYDKGNTAPIMGAQDRRLKLMRAAKYKSSTDSSTNFHVIYESEAVDSRDPTWEPFTLRFADVARAVDECYSQCKMPTSRLHGTGGYENEAESKYVAKLAYDARLMVEVFTRNGKNAKTHPHTIGSFRFSLREFSQSKRCPRFNAIDPAQKRAAMSINYAHSGVFVVDTYEEYDVMGHPSCRDHALAAVPACPLLLSLLFPYPRPLMMPVLPVAVRPLARSRRSPNPVLRVCLHNSPGPKERWLVRVLTSIPHTCNHYHTFLLHTMAIILIPRRSHHYRRHHHHEQEQQHHHLHYHRNHHHHRHHNRRCHGRPRQI
eukprot:TRINITY_DN8705_c0_g1_i1.p1 TRINITY_DN8705_c0_g1~~TRINITY_DN8705_c0_g1_i1.p1  ORF type:complete len:427 (+),score=44.84 TRINITY_DN8705_c0_g1_i1:234-1514(+)